MKKILVTLVSSMFIMASCVMSVSATESLDAFNYKAYADTYPDLKAVYGYDATLLYNHYMLCGKAEGKVASFNATSGVPVQPVLTSLQDLVPTSSQIFDNRMRGSYNIGPDDWTGAMYFRAGNGKSLSYADYSLGGGYTTLTFKATPYKDGSFFKSSTCNIYVVNQDTGKILAQKEINWDILS